jgi:predicted transcriptional regulator
MQDMQQITVKLVEKPKEKVVEEDIQWMCDSFGFCAGRDTNMTTPRIVSTLLERFADDVGVASDIVANDLAISSALVNHHVRQLMSSGLVYRERKLIFLRGGSLKAAVEEMRKDANRLFDEISDMAQEIDNAVGLRSRR